MEIKEYLGKEIHIKIDRPFGSKHPKHNFIYPVNYVYVPNTVSCDGEDAMFLKKKRGERYMLADGTFVRAGDTPEESRSGLEDRLDDAIYSKPLAFVKNLSRKIKNR